MNDYDDDEEEYWESKSAPYETKKGDFAAENADGIPDIFIIKKQTLHLTLSFKCSAFIIYPGGD